VVSRSSALLCIVLVSSLVLSGATTVAATAVGGVGAGDGTETSQAGSSFIPDLQEGPDPDATVTRIETRPDGAANWSVTIRIRLDSEDAVGEFEAFREEFEANRSTYLGRFRERMTGVVGNAAAVTEREMNATGFDSEVGIQEVPRRWGYVTYRFRWDGFAAVADGDVVVGDVFQGGLFLEGDDILILEGPATYAVESTDPEPDSTDDGQLQWNGPRSFEDQRPRAVFTPEQGGSTADTETATTDGNEPGSSDLPLSALVVAVAVLALAAGGAVYFRRGGAAPDSSDPAAGTEGDGPATPGDSPATGRGAEADGTPGSAAASAGTGGAAALGLDELATDEDRVLALLEAEGGRIRQAEIADRLDWSASKTSRVVSGMAEDGTIEKLRIGRENVIDLANDESEPDGP
jgi:uncharacterized membrane protein